MTSKICAAVQINSGNIEVNKVLFEKILKFEPDLLELRLDYIEDSSFLTKDFITNLLAEIQPKIPVILTLREKSEGGYLDIEPERRFDIIKMLIKAKPDYIDIEMNTPPQTMREIINLAVYNKIKIICSYHDFEKTPSLEDGKEIITDFLRRLVTFCTQITDKSGPFIYKTIFKANSFEDNYVPLKMCKFFTKMGEDRNVICFSMGEYGAFSRIMCVKAGSSFTYGSIDQATAPGQMTVKKIREMHQLLFEN